MNSINRLIQCKSLWFISSLVVALMLMLSACGNAINTGTGSSPTNPRPTATVSQSQALVYGCPSNIVAGSLPAATVTLKGSSFGKPVSLKQGDTLEIDLAFGHIWSNPNVTPQGLLTAQSTAGYISKSANACIWRFTAASTGTVHINFTGRPNCTMGHACPMYIVDTSLVLTIK